MSGDHVLRTLVLPWSCWLAALLHLDLDIVVTLSTALVSTGPGPATGQSTRGTGAKVTIMNVSLSVMTA